MIIEETCVCGAMFRLERTSEPDFVGAAGYRDRWRGEHKRCLELKSLKMYTLAYRNLGIFQENIVNRMLEDVVHAAQPLWATLKGDFTPRGGISTRITRTWQREKNRKKRSSKRAR